MSLRLLHTGDLHLGMTFKTRGYPEELRQELVAARFRALERMVAQADQENCQLLVVAGDLFERCSVPEKTVLQAVEILARFGGICAVLPGNHDFINPHSTLWEHFQKNAPDNVLLLGEMVPYDLQDHGLDVTLYPGPCDAKHSPDNRIGWISVLPARPETRWHLGVAHGALEGYSPDFEQKYFPMQPAELAAAGLDFWLLGHTHVPVPPGESFQDQVFSYCGTPEPDGFDCQHSGSAWLLDVDDDGQVQGQAVETGYYRFLDWERHVHAAHDWGEIKKQLASYFPRGLVRLTVDGSMPREDFEKRHQAITELRETALYLEVNDFHLQMEITEQVIGELFAQDSFPYLLLQRLAERGDSKALQKAYSLVQEVHENP